MAAEQRRVAALEEKLAERDRVLGQLIKNDTQVADEQQLSALRENQVQEKDEELAFFVFSCLEDDFFLGGDDVSSTSLLCYTRS